MRVLTVATDLGIGGTQRVAQNLTIGMQSRGADVAFLAHRNGGPRQAHLAARNIETFVVSSDKTLATALDEATTWKPDIVHIHRTGRPDAGETAILRQLRGTGAKVVETNVFARYDWTEGGELIDAHCQLSRWCAYKWHSWAGRKADNKLSFLLPYAVDIDSIHPLPADERAALRSKFGVPAGRFLFGRIGQPLEPKWDPEILNAFRQVVEAGHDVGLLLVGAPASYPGRVAALPQPVRDRILFLPTTSNDKELQGYFSVLDSFLHLAHIGESFGMVLCEAMLAGVPVVTLSTPLRDNSQLEVIGHGQGGVVALDAAAVPKAMIALMGDSALRQRVRDTGRDWVASRYAVDKITADLAAIYDVVLGVTAPADSPIEVNNPPSLAWIDDMLSRGIGTGMSPIERAQFRAIHTPLGYKAYFAARKLLRR